VTVEAFDAYVCTQADDSPFIATTRVRFAQTHDIFQLQVWQHAGIISRGGIIAAQEVSMFYNLDLPTIISRVVVLLTAFSFHEFAHAWTAVRFGDDTPRIAGRLTLNPLAHLDPLGSIMLIAAGFGWAKPVQVNPYVLQRRSAAAMMWVSLAGPASNLLLAVIASIPFQIGIVSAYSANFSPGTVIPTLDKLLYEFVLINLLLCLFNLIPIAPLDGEKIFTYFLPANIAGVFDTIRPYGPMILLALVFLGPLLGINLLGMIIGPPLQALMSILVG
jgi:Zn-dependent protease